jgi:hypothetical protein
MQLPWLASLEIRAFQLQAMNDTAEERTTSHL